MIVYLTVYYWGRRTEARRVELLPNGRWRADLRGGLVALYESDPRDDRDAVQVS